MCFPKVKLNFWMGLYSSYALEWASSCYDADRTPHTAHGAQFRPV